MAILKSIKNQVVIRRRGNKIILSAWPRARSPAAKPSAREKEIQSDFRRASIYATNAVKDPACKEAYAAVRRGNQTAYNVAFLDAYKGPQLSKLRTGRYTGHPGQLIVVQAKDNFRVKGVQFTLFSGDGRLIESGEALRKINSNDWLYITRLRCESLSGVRICVSARDIPGNVALLETVL